MILANLPCHKASLGILRRPDGEEFTLTCALYESPFECDYWPVSYDAEHREWGHMRYTGIIPKRIAPSEQMGSALATGNIAAQLKHSLNAVTETGRAIEAVFSYDGWVLI